MGKNNPVLGFILGLIVPLFGTLFLYLIKFMPQNISLSEFIQLAKNNQQNIPKVISLSLLACIPLITYYKNRRCYRTLNGVFAAILMYAAVVVAYKLHWL
jgi:hypothetical protein